MNFFSNQKTWFFIALFFIAVNIALIIGFFMKGRDRHPMRQHSEMKRFHRDHREMGMHRSFLHAAFIADTLGFSDEQRKQMERVEMGMNKKKDSIFDLSENCKISFNRELFSENPEKAKLDSLIRCISSSTEAYNRLRIEKVMGIRAICTPEQLVKFTSILSEISERKRFHGHK